MQTAASTSGIQNRPYQGYPYISPQIIDAPSVHPSSQNWSNLPRRLAFVPTKHNEQNSVTVENEKKNGEDKRSTKEDNAEETSSENDEIPPEVYVDIVNGSDLYESEVEREKNVRVKSTDFMNNIIYFNPFEDRNNTESTTTSLSSTPYPSTNQSVPSATTSSNAEPTLPPMMSKETDVYRRPPHPDDELILAPLPVVDYPDPPPAYSDIDISSPRPSRFRARLSSGLSRLSPNLQQSQEPPPRTVIITPQTISGTQDLSSLTMVDPEHKVVFCQHCGSRVQTTVLRQSGVLTHCIGLAFLLLCLFPITLLVYCTDYFKNKNHYCPVCSKLIGYEVPLLCQKLVYTR